MFLEIAARSGRLELLDSFAEFFKKKGVGKNFETFEILLGGYANMDASGTRVLRVSTHTAIVLFIRRLVLAIVNVY